MAMSLTPARFSFKLTDKLIVEFKALTLLEISLIWLRPVALLLSSAHKKTFTLATSSVQLPQHSYTLYGFERSTPGGICEGN